MIKKNKKISSFSACRTYQCNHKVIFITTSFALFISSVFIFLQSSAQKRPESGVTVRLTSNFLIDQSNRKHINGTIYQEVCKEFQPRHTILVIVRTFLGHSQSLPTLLSTLLLSCARTAHVSLRFILLNTDQETWRETTFMVNALNQVKDLLVNCKCACAEIRTFSTPPWKDSYGYDYTQWALNDALNTNGPEDYILFTNGDNIFNVGLFSEMLQHLDAGVDLAAFQFVSHYDLNGGRYRQMHVRFEPGRIDLSSLFFRKQALKEARAAGGANFIPKGRQSYPFEGRDGIFVKAMVSRNVTKVISHGVLLFHQ